MRLVRVSRRTAATGAHTRKARGPREEVAHGRVHRLSRGRKKFKSLKRHLRSKYNMSPEQYREKWNLPADYPMVAPNYASHTLCACQEDGARPDRVQKR